MPRILIGSGLEGVGRRSYLDRAIVDNLALHLGPFVFLSETNDLTDIYFWHSTKPLNCEHALRWPTSSLHSSTHDRRTGRGNRPAFESALQSQLCSMHCGSGRASRRLREVQGRLRSASSTLLPTNLAPIPSDCPQGVAADSRLDTLCSAIAQKIPPLEQHGDQTTSCANSASKSGHVLPGAGGRGR